MITPLERSENWVRSVIYDEYVPYGENPVKIDPVDPEINLLQEPILQLLLGAA